MNSRQSHPPRGGTNGSSFERRDIWYAVCVCLRARFLRKFKTVTRVTIENITENTMKLTSRTTFPPSGKEKGTSENSEVSASASFLDEVSFNEGEYLEKLSEFRALVLRRIRAHIDDEDEKEEEEDNGEENDDD